MSSQKRQVPFRLELSKERVSRVAENSQVIRNSMLFAQNLPTTVLASHSKTARLPAFREIEAVSDGLQGHNRLLTFATAGLATPPATAQTRSRASLARLKVSNSRAPPRRRPSRRSMTSKKSARLEKWSRFVAASNACNVVNRRSTLKIVATCSRRSWPPESSRIRAGSSKTENRSFSRWTHHAKNPQSPRRQSQGRLQRSWANLRSRPVPIREE